MDSCEAVEKELQRVISKFNGVHEHSKRMLGDVTKNFEELRSSIAEGMEFFQFVFIICLFAFIVQCLPFTFYL